MSLELLEEHRRIWRDKPVLETIYRPWFNVLLDEVVPAARVLEVGAGPGFFRTHAHALRPDVRWIASDLTPAGWNDLSADAQRLPMRAESVDAIVGLDVIHHLARPDEFLDEAGRVLRPGGRLAVIEPWVTAFSYPIYRWLHQEGCRSDLDPWRPFASRPVKDAFDGDNGVFTQILTTTPPDRWRSFGLRPPRVSVLNGFAYLMSLGFRKRSLLPCAAAPFASWLDKLASPLAHYFGMRALAVWERAGS